MPHHRLTGGTAASLAAVLTVAATAGFAAAPATGAELYANKTVTALIGYPPGGGYDAYMRLVGRHYGKHLPGNPTIVPKNFPGAGSLRAANFIYNNAPRDGTVIGIFASSTLFSIKLGETKGQFEIDKFTWIGNLDQTTGTCTVWHESGLSAFKEFFDREVIFGASGPTAVNSTHAKGFNTLFGTRIKVINGYPGSTSVLLAMKRGEVHGGCGFALSSLKATRRQEWQSGQLKVVIQTGFEKHPELEGIPHIYDFAKSEDDKKAMHLIYGTHILGRPISAPPAIPAENTKALRAAFSAMVKDPAFLADAGKLHLPIAPWSGEEVEKIIARFASYPDHIYARATKVLDAGSVVKVKLKEVDGTIAEISKRSISVKGSDGKTAKMRVSGRRSKVTVGGKEAKATALKVGMSCSFSYFGEGDFATKVACK
jgi:tripartite-type tricarboxylate transporter receptor subunit TctC